MSVEKKKEFKGYHLRLPKELWVYLKEKATQEEKKMSEVIINLLQKSKEKDNKKC